MLHLLFVYQRRHVQLTSLVVLDRELRGYELFMLEFLKSPPEQGSCSKRSWEKFVRSKTGASISRPKMKGGPQHPASMFYDNVSGREMGSSF